MQTAAAVLNVICKTMGAVPAMRTPQLRALQLRRAELNHDIGRDGKLAQPGFRDAAPTSYCIEFIGTHRDDTGATGTGEITELCQRMKAVCAHKASHEAFGGLIIMRRNLDGKEAKCGHLRFLFSFGSSMSESE
nr:hypothetical protein [Neorhizobium galegae]